jgi:hypothetical protein
MNPYPRIYPQVRGGFSPLSTGQWTPSIKIDEKLGLSGLGDDSLYTDAGVDPNYTGTQVSTDNPLSVSNVLASVPSSLWLLAGGFIALAFIWPSGRK